MAQSSNLPDLKEELILWKNNFLVIGIDEVGRGAFAGPLLLSGVVFEPILNKSKDIKLLSYGINDSKKLSPKKRVELTKIIKQNSLFYYHATVSVKEINKIGIGKATCMGVRKIIKKLKKEFPDKKIFLLMDAFTIKYIKGLGLANQKAIIKGDEKSLSIAAASIIAKVKRDSMMRRLNKEYSGYGFYSNKGYGTKDHREAIKKLGITIVHREVFVQKTLTEQ